MFDLVHLAMRRAVAEFGGKDGDKVFNAAGFSVAFAAWPELRMGSMAVLWKRCCAVVVTSSS